MNFTIMDHNLEAKMKYKKLVLRSLLFLISAGAIFGVYTKVKAQGEIEVYLEERFKQQNVPVVEITVLQKLPINLQVAIQSISDGEKAAPEDPINLNLVNHEVILASQQGYLIERFAVILLNNKGEQMARVEHSTEITDFFIATNSSSISDEATLSEINGKMNLYGLSLMDQDISSSNGVQTVNMTLSTQSVDAANVALPQFMPSLRLLLEDVNSQGAQITICKLQLKDKNGDLLLNYIIDLQLRTENWWMADNLTQDWFPHP